MKMRRWSFASLAASAMLSLIEVAGAQSAPGGSRWPAASRIVVVPDVHGAYDELTDLLEATGIVGAELEWAGGDARLVSLGDLLDRGPDSRRVMDLLMRLEREAPAAGGRVHVLLGNHELMNLTGDLRYVSADEFAAFAAEESDAMREAAFAEYRARRPEPADDDEARVVFDATYPLGYFAHREAFAADGRYGSWLLGLPSLIVIGDTAFVHGGLPQAVAGTTADALNAQIAAELKRRAGDRDRQRDARDARDAAALLRREGFGLYAEIITRLSPFDEERLAAFFDALDRRIRPMRR
ncbi:MAG: metallophosphoesterase [Gammaproteobacteria bacterium]|nr:metallophosphoesterase [Gammaproteobacteria bacterium]